ncbi:MAG TPA: glycoside hydrolase family 11 protein [Prolixibacteraceae bacterium]|nr:glycoside hydrolase family 11 protein [Prolixibacteraceae bacterium]HPS11840.1 glycoside hydrolase family 11 protein [Prolixibacteraceae bacterium]
MKQKLLCTNLSVIAFSFGLLFVTPPSNAQTINANKTGTQNGFYYSYWNQGSENTSYTGIPVMTLGDAGNYSVTWSNVYNFTAGKGWSTGSPDRIIDFSGTFDGGSNGYLAVYGWTKNKLIEYYVVESYGSWTPPGGTSKGTFTSDGGTYNIYETTRTNQPSIIGTATFQQYWSVRTTKRSSGKVTFANHVAAWKAKGMELGTTWDYQIMETEGYHSSGSSNITVSEGTASSETSLSIDKDFDVYPNPVKDKLNFTLPGSQSEVRLLSVNGAQRMVFKTENPKIEIDMSNYEAGIYILEVLNERQTITKKIIKQ